MKQHKLLLNHQLQLICIVALALLVGCNSTDVSDLEQYIAQVKMRPKEPIPPLPEVKLPEPFIFRPDDLRDPFKPTQTDVVIQPPGGRDAGGVKGPDTSRRKEELEAFPLETLKMIGTVNMKGTLWGLIKSSDSTVYRVRVGNYMGQNYGKIIRIAPDRIELMEIVPDPPDKWLEQQMTVMLEDETGSKQ